MLLVAMGYDSAVEGFTGSNWDYGVLKTASAAGLFEGFTASVNEGCIRDNAALLVYNALIGDCVSYVGNTAVATGDTLIGTYYVKEAAVVTNVVEELNYNTDKEYFAVLDGTKYFESGLYWADDISARVAGGPEPRPDEKAFFWQIPEDMDAGAEYKCYLDDFGNIVAFEPTARAAETGYFLVTGAAYEDISKTQVDSLVYGAKPATELTVGVQAYTAGRDGRGNDVIDGVAELYKNTAHSIDKAYYVYVGRSGAAIYGINAFQYIEYENVFNVNNVLFNSGDMAPPPEA